MPIPLSQFTILLALGISIGTGAHGAEPAYDQEQRYEVALPGETDIPAASIREHAIAWHPIWECYYLAADVVPLDSPHHPNTYETSIHLWRSPDLSDWTYLGVAVPRGGDGRFDAHGASSPAAMTYRDGRLYIAYSARKTARLQSGVSGWRGRQKTPRYCPGQPTPKQLAICPEKTMTPAS